MSGQATKLSVLLVDDDELGRLALAAVLEDAGYVITEAASLAEARLELPKHPYDVAILDLNLPDGRGTDLIPEVLRAHPGITVAMLSGENSFAVDGAHAYITKAVAPDELLAQLAAARETATRARSAQVSGG